MSEMSESQRILGQHPKQVSMRRLGRKCKPSNPSGGNQLYLLWLIDDDLAVSENIPQWPFQGFSNWVGKTVRKSFVRVVNCEQDNTIRR